MTVYDYIASCNPSGAKRVINSYGYRVINPSTMGRNLRLLVAQEGEPALRSILELHPDKEIIVDVFGHSAESSKTESKNFLNADGATLETMFSTSKNAQANSDATNKMVLQGNTFLYVTAIVVVSAIVLKKLI